VEVNREFTSPLVTPTLTFMQQINSKRDLQAVTATASVSPHDVSAHRMRPVIGGQ
jgi:hypothetical protein